MGCCASADTTGMIAEVDSQYFTTLGDQPADPKALLQSYEAFYAAYLDHIATWFAAEPVRTVKGTLKATTSAYKSGPQKRNYLEVTVSYTVELGQTVMNKIVNDVAKSGRAHKDHKIKAILDGATVEDEGIVSAIKDACVVAFQDRLEKARAAGKAEDDDQDVTVESIELETAVKDFDVTEADLVSGFGFVGTWDTEVNVPVGELTTCQYTGFTPPRG